jgi:MFS family permease
MDRRGLITEANRKWWTLGAMCLSMFMIMLDSTVVNVALPSIQKDLDTSVDQLEWLRSPVASPIGSDRGCRWSSGWSSPPSRSTSSRG